MDLPLEGRISGPSTGFEVTVPGRQGIRAMRNSIPLAGAPTSIETSLRGLLCFPRFLLVVSRQRRAPCSQAGILHLAILLTSTLHHGMLDSSGGLQMRLSFDHRVLDGTTAARALEELETVLLCEILQECTGLA